MSTGRAVRVGSFLVESCVFLLLLFRDGRQQSACFVFILLQEFLRLFLRQLNVLQLLYKFILLLWKTVAHWRERESGCQVKRGITENTYVWLKWNNKRIMKSAKITELYKITSHEVPDKFSIRFCYFAFLSYQEVSKRSPKERDREIFICKYQNNLKVSLPKRDDFSPQLKSFQKVTTTAG